MQGGGGAQESWGGPPNVGSSASSIAVFSSPLQRERLKNIERICCLLRKVSVRAWGRRLLVQVGLTLRHPEPGVPPLGPV